MDFCPECGSQLLHLEGCLFCLGCGWSVCTCKICNGEEIKNVQSKTE